MRIRCETSAETVAAVFTDESVAALRASVLDGKAVEGVTEGYPDPVPPGPDREQTTSFNVADRAGNVICCTQTLGVSFGSGMVVPGTVVCLNDLHYFGDVDPAAPNALRPGMPLGLPIAPGSGMGLPSWQSPASGKQPPRCKHAGMTLSSRMLGASGSGACMELQLSRRRA